MEYVDLESEMTAVMARVAFDRVIEGMLKLFPPDADMESVNLPKEWPIPFTQILDIFPELRDASAEKVKIYYDVAQNRWKDMISTCQEYELRDPNELFAPDPEPWTRLMQALTGSPFKDGEDAAKAQVENFTSLEFFEYNLSNNGVDRHNNGIAELVDQIVNAQITVKEKQYLLDRISQHNNSVLTRDRIQN